MRITLSKLASNLNPIFSKPLVGMAVAAALFGAACGGGTSSTPGTGGSSSAGSGGNSAGGASGGSSGGGTTGTGGNGTGGSAAGSSGSAGNGTGGSTGGTSVGAGGNSTGGSAGGGTAGSSGGNVGTGGAQAGRGGNSAGGSGGASAGAGGKGGGATGTAGTTGTGGTTPACPSNATFCSGFEEASGAPPMATLQVYTGMFSDVMALDTTIFNSGKQSLQVKSGTSPSAFRMLSVPIPSSAFWVRLYVRSDSVFGNMTAVHNAFFEAMEAGSAGQQVNANSKAVQFAEQWCQVLMNASDQLYPMNLSSCSTTGPTLSANQWHCVEAFFDGGSGAVQIYADGMKVIDAASWNPSKLTYGAFAFGFAQYSGPARTMWFDDVAVAPTRIGGCN